mgnify:CR=1 FL=1
MRSVRVRIWFAVAGAATGYLTLFVLANLEDWQFYTIRSLVTGRRVMSEIVAHPADRWVGPALFVGFMGGGAMAGALMARCPRRRLP